MVTRSAGHGTPVPTTKDDTAHSNTHNKGASNQGNLASPGKGWLDDQHARQRSGVSLRVVVQREAPGSQVLAYKYAHGSTRLE